MKMNVKYFLACGGSDIELKFVACEIFSFCKPFGSDYQMAEEMFIFFPHVCDGWDMFFWND